MLEWFILKAFAEDNSRFAFDRMADGGGKPEINSFHGPYSPTILNPLPHMPILGSSNSTASKDMMSDIRTNGETIILFSRKHCGKRNCS